MEKQNLVPLGRTTAFLDISRDYKITQDGPKCLVFGTIISFNDKGEYFRHFSPHEFYSLKKIELDKDIEPYKETMDFNNNFEEFLNE